MGRKMDFYVADHGADYLVFTGRSSHPAVTQRQGLGDGIGCLPVYFTGRYCSPTTVEAVVAVAA
jgi:hypothetical protein